MPKTGIFLPLAGSLGITALTRNNFGLGLHVRAWSQDAGDAPGDYNSGHWNLLSGSGIPSEQVSFYTLSAVRKIQPFPSQLFRLGVKGGSTLVDYHRATFIPQTVINSG